MDFVAIDVETANPKMASICQVGIAGYECGQVTREWCTYVDPEDRFDPLNVLTHGIDEDTAAMAMPDGQTKSRKHRRAEKLIAAGRTLRILRETDFMQLVRPRD